MLTPGRVLLQLVEAGVAVVAVTATTADVMVVTANDLGAANVPAGSKRRRREAVERHVCYSETLTLIFCCARTISSIRGMNVFTNSWFHT